MLEDRIKNSIREIQDFPKPGILYKDITTLLADPVLCNDILDMFLVKLDGRPVDAVAGVESRGFLFGFRLAAALHCPFVLIRKSGKLPYTIVSHEYELEYGKAVIEMHTDAVQEGWKVLIHDDLLATGGTAAAAAELILRQKAEISGFAFLLELAFLHGRKDLIKYSSNIFSLASYS